MPFPHPRTDRPAVEIPAAPGCCNQILAWLPDRLPQANPVESQDRLPPAVLHLKFVRSFV